MFHRESGVFKTTYAADMALYPLPIAKWTVIALAALFVLIIPLTVHEYYLSILIFIAIVGALGLNILVGYTGQISIGHGAFMSVGAYTAANLAVRLGLPFWLTLPAGGLMAALIGVFVGMPSLGIKGLYLAIATLAGDLGWRAGVDRGRPAEPVRLQLQHPGPPLFLPSVLRRARHRGDA